jgi:pentatricopeptide repeat protein
MATLHEIRGEYTKSQALLEERLQLSLTVEDDASLVESQELLACSTFHQGAFTRALDHAEQGLRLYDVQDHLALIAFVGENPAVSCHTWAGLSLWFLGYLDQALERIDQALKLAQEPVHSFSLAHATQRAACLYQLRGEVQAVQEWAEATIALATRRGFPYQIGVGTLLRGWALTVHGDYEAGLAQLREGLAACQATGSYIEHPYFLALLAEGYGQAGQFEEGLEVLDEALEMGGHSQTFFFEPELLRLKGSLLLQTAERENVVEAEANFQQALDMARRRKAKSLELRAAMSLSRLWRRQGQEAAALQLLSKIYSWFSEGFTTKLLQQAKALLEELGSEQLTRPCS